MNDYLPKKELEPDPDPKRPSNTRLAIWIIVGAIGLVPARLRYLGPRHAAG